MREAECQTLQQRYTCRSNLLCDSEPFYGNDQIAGRLASFAVTEPAEASLHEQEERELAPENEEERQVERPAPVSARNSRLDPEVVEFVTTGRASLMTG